MEKLSKVHTRTFNRLQQLMLEYSFSILYKPGRENVVPDFLSRNPISAVDISLDTLVSLQNKDQLICDLKELLRNKSHVKNKADKLFRTLGRKLAIRNNVLYYTGRKTPAIFAPLSLHADILQSAHNSLGGGHMGMFKTRERILMNYYWPSLDSDISKHIKQCISCQKTKPYNCLLYTSPSPRDS